MNDEPTDDKPKNRWKNRGTTLASIAEAVPIAFVERLRWPDGSICVHCGHTKSYRLNGASCRPGLRKCAKCRKKFTVRIGTIFEDSHIPLRHWLLAIHQICAGKKGVSAHQIMRSLEVQYKTAWFMMHRVRTAMKDPDFGMLSGIVEADETYIGPKNVHGKRGRGAGRKKIVFGLVERGGRVRSFPIKRVTAKTLKGIIPRARSSGERHEHRRVRVLQWTRWGVQAPPARGPLEG
jgi:transposase-like protein